VYVQRYFGGDGGCRMDEARAGTTFPIPDHKLNTKMGKVGESFNEEFVFLSRRRLQNNLLATYRNRDICLCAFLQKEQEILNLA